MKLWTTGTISGNAAEASLGLVAIGASFVDITISGSTHAFIGNHVDIGQTVDGGVNDIFIQAVSNVNPTATAIGLSGGILAAAGANFAFVDIQPDVQAYIGTSSNVRVNRNIFMNAEFDTKAEANGIGVFAAGAFSAGFMLVDINLGRGDGVDEVEASIREGSIVDADFLQVGAQSRQNSVMAESIAGNGGLVSLLGSFANVDNDLSAVAKLGNLVRVNTAGLVISSVLDQAVDSRSDSVSVAVASGTGARTDNKVTSQSNIYIGTGVEVNAGTVRITALNELRKNGFEGSRNLRSSTVSFLGSINVLSSTTDIGTAANRVSGGGQYRRWEPPRGHWSLWKLRH